MKKFTVKLCPIVCIFFLFCTQKPEQGKFFPILANLKPEQRLKEVFPEKIQNAPRKLSRLILPEGMYGSQAEYGNMVRLQVIELKSKEVFNQFYLEILPKYLSRYQIMYQKKLATFFQLEAQGSEGELFLVFFEFPWLVTIEVVQQQLLAEVMQKFPYFQSY